VAAGCGQGEAGVVPGCCMGHGRGGPSPATSDHADASGPTYAAAEQPSASSEESRDVPDSLMTFAFLNFTALILGMNRNNFGSYLAFSRTLRIRFF
jgi:hypothetical protein